MSTVPIRSGELRFKTMSSWLLYTKSFIHVLRYRVFKREDCIFQESSHWLWLVPHVTSIKQFMLSYMSLLPSWPCSAWKGRNLEGENLVLFIFISPESNVVRQDFRQLFLLSSIHPSNHLLYFKLTMKFHYVPRNLVFRYIKMSIVIISAPKVTGLWWVTYIKTSLK